MTSGDEVADVVCLIVHHRSPATLFTTIDGIVAAGVPRAQIVVVDNGGDDRAVAEVITRGSRALSTANRGYAAAVNEGLRFVDESGLRCDYVLVATHESVPAPSAVRHLREAMLSDPLIAAAGPTLWDGASEDRVWSRGGFLTPRLTLPRHHIEVDPRDPRQIVDRDWLDGAFVLYRADALRETGFDESYFLYFEETDLHTRLRRSGRRVVWVPSAEAAQTTGGIPPRLLGRNLFLYQSRHFSVWRGRAGAGFESVRAVARYVITQRGSKDAGLQIIAGWMEGERIRRGVPTRRPYPSEERTA